VNWSQVLGEIAELPSAQQLPTLRRLRRNYPICTDEEWNTAFNPDSLYTAWTSTHLMRDLYRHNRDVVRPILAKLEEWHIVEVGGGNGALWRDFFRRHQRGRLTLIDPDPGAHQAVASALPESIEFESVIAPVEEARVPTADLVICSLTLHHLGGRDTAERQAHQLTGPGKCEVLRDFVEAVRARRGLCILNEADVYAEIDLPPGNPALINNLIGSYIHRAAMALATEVESSERNPDLRRKLETILLHWLVDQPERAGSASLDKRDVYELDVPNWLELLARAGAHVHQCRCTDEWGLFHQYVFSPTRSPIP